MTSILHDEGEQFLLSTLFAGVAMPTNLYLGLDNRTTLAASDTLASLVSEPTVNGYARQAVNSASFTVVFTGGAYQANTPIVTFSATGGSWGPVNNLFLATSSDNSGKLIATVTLNQADLILIATQVMRIRMGLSLRDCP
jgi:hypothetical protein